MSLNTRGMFDPRFTKAFAAVDRAGMTASVLIRRLLPDRDPEKAVWDYSTGKYVGTDFKPVWSGVARVQPSLDWRAKTATFAEVTTATNAARVVMPMFRGEWFVEEHELLYGDQVIVTDTAFPGLDQLKKFALVIRNPLLSSNAGSLKALCDVDVKLGVNLDYSH